MEQRYNACIEKLYSIAPSFQNVGSSAYHPGLKTMEDFAAVMGDPQNRFRSIHIAGTNGKGSTAHFLASALSFLHPGKKIGLYTSPHLVDFRERVRVVTNESVEMITREEVVEFMDRYEAFINERRPSFFEITTAMAFEHFASVGVEFAVIETGLGGRLDSTNIIHSDLSIITSVGLDHVNILGDTIEKIAREKAGIIKHGKPVVTGQLLPDAMKEIRMVAEERSAQLYDSTEVFGKLRSGEAVISSDTVLDPDTDTERNSALAAVYVYDAASFDLKSDSQKINFHTVLTALKVLGFDLVSNCESVMYALRNAACISGLCGRWERINEMPRAICDIGHNPEAMRISMAQLSREALEIAQKSFEATSVAHPAYKDGLSRKPHIYMVYGMVADKDVSTVANLLPAEATYIFTQPHGPRAMSADSLADIVLDSIRRRSVIDSDGPMMSGTSTAPIEYHIVPEPQDAYCLALHLALPSDLIFVGGSSFVVSEVLAFLQNS